MQGVLQVPLPLWMIEMPVQNPRLLCLSRTASEPFPTEESDTTLSTVSSSEDPEPECEANQYMYYQTISAGTIARWR